MSMLLVLCFLSHVASSSCMYMLHAHTASPCWMPMLHVYVSMLQCREMDKRTVATDILAMLLMDPFRIGPKKLSWKKIVPGPRLQLITFGGLEAVSGGMFVTPCGRVFLPGPCGCRTRWTGWDKSRTAYLEPELVSSGRPDSTSAGVDPGKKTH